MAAGTEQRILKEYALLSVVFGAPELPDPIVESGSVAVPRCLGGSWTCPVFPPDLNPNS